MDQAGIEEPAETIAVIGMSGSYPGAPDLARFWDNLRDGIDSITRFSEEEHEPPPLMNADRWVLARGLMDRPEWFDAEFFGYTPDEAIALDPQNRVLLERGWEVLENAGYNPEEYPGSVGVFAGSGFLSYLLSGVIAGSEAVMGPFLDKDFLATRLSYKLNLKGPSLVVQAACSTSLVAISLACQSLLDYQCDMAIAGGSSIQVPLLSGYPYQPGSPLSLDGYVRTFDVAATGFVPGSGVGAVLLKRLSEALDDGDNVLAVVRGSAVNNDGSAKVGYAAPSVDGQAEVIALAQEVAGVDPDTISYIEAHGTGTELGDPIEVAALTKAFRTRTQRTGFCAVGSLKPNVGHLDAAAGVAGFQKVVMALQHRQIPPSIHFEAPNPKIDFENSPFVVNSQLRAWEGGSTPRRAGVSSFGIGGTNAHVVVEEAPRRAPTDPGREWQLLPLSARTPSALQTMATNLADHLETTPDENLADVAYTLQVGRKGFSRRASVVGRSVEEVIAGLRALDPSAAKDAVRNQGALFLFPGQGSQYPGMCRGLYETEPVFRSTVDRCGDLLRPSLGLDLTSVVYPASNDEQAMARLTQTEFAQPAIFVMGYAMAQLLASLGVRPEACIGHSIGEYVAACLAGVLTLEDALDLVAVRAQLMNRTPEGSMLALGLGPDEVAPWLSDDIALAAANGPALSVLSGPKDTMAKLRGSLKESGIASIELQASHAFHSRLMDPILDEFRAYVHGVRFEAPSLPYVSNVSGSWIDASQATDPEYWVAHLRGTVRFAVGLGTLLSLPGALVEVGPGRTLTQLASTHPERAKDRVVTSTSRSQRSRHSDLESLLRGVGALWESGVAVDWPALHGQARRRRIPLPTYPFERKRYWPRRSADRGPLLRRLEKRRDVGSWMYAPVWRSSPGVIRPRSGGPLPLDAYLIFLDRRGVGERLASQLAAGGRTVATVSVGERFEQRGDLAFAIPPADAGAYTELFESLGGLGVEPTSWIHLWGLDDAVPSPADGLLAFSHLARALADFGGRRIRLTVAGNRGHRVLAGESVSADRAVLLAACRVLPQELSHVRTTYVDLDLGPAADTDRPADQILAELARPEAEPVVAYRGMQRWLQTFEQLDTTGLAGAAPAVRPGGTYLITGGLGNVGFVAAEVLARQAPVNLVLVGRSAGLGGPAGHRVQKLEELGARVAVEAGDVSDLARMREIVERAEQDFGPLRGVIHAAGELGGTSFRLMQDLDLDVCEAQFRSKVDGVRVLEELLGERELDFCLLTSSLSSTLGGIAYGPYVAANAFMDAFAAGHNQRMPTQPWSSVGFDAWDFSERPGERPVASGLAALAMTPAEGAEVITRLLAMAPLDQTIVSTGDLELRLDQWVRLTSLRDDDPDDRVTHARPDSAVEFVEPATPTEAAVASAWARSLGFDRVGRSDDFLQLGGHSLLALEVVNEMRRTFSVNLGLSDLFDNPTVRQFSEHIDTLVWASAEPVQSDADQLEEGIEEVVL